MGGQCAEPFLGGLGRLAIVTGMCQESLLGAPVPERPTPEIAGGSEGGRAMVEEGRGGSRRVEEPRAGSGQLECEDTRRGKRAWSATPPTVAGPASAWVVGTSVVSRAAAREGSSQGGQQEVT
jgi:hypothetical protein